MKLTYEEIVSQISQMMGYRGYGDSLKANIRYAVKFAEQELHTDTGINKRTETINFSNTESEKLLPYDYNEPCEITFFDTANNKLLAENTTYPELLSNSVQASTVSVNDDEIRTADSTIQDLQNNNRYFERVIFAIDFNDGGYRIGWYPKFNGSVRLYYSSIPVDDVYSSLKQSPTLPEHFHRFIIFGATAYLADIESSKKATEKDYDSANYFRKLSAEMSAKFAGHKTTTKSLGEQQNTAQIIKSFMWYDNPLKYRSRR